MAQKIYFSITAVKVITPDGKVRHYPSGKDFAILSPIANISQVPSLYGAGTDSLILCSDGWQYTSQQEFSDLLTAISVVSSTGS